MRLTIPCLCLALCSWVQSSMATELSLEASLGVASVTNQDYETAGVIDHAMVIRQSGFSFRVGGIYIDDMVVEDQDDNNAHIDVRAAYLGINKAVQVDEVTIEFGGGAIFSKSRAFFNDRELSEDEDTSPYVNAKVVFDINDVVAIHTDWKYIDDLSGGNINLFQAGVRLTFF